MHSSHTVHSRQNTTCHFPALQLICQCKQSLQLCNNQCVGRCVHPRQNIDIALLSASIAANLPTDDSCCSCQVSIVNSTWTANHIRQLWWQWSPPICVFPPCNTDAFQQLPLDRKLKRLYLVSVAQFRPEKNHELQLRAFGLARTWASEADSQGHSAGGQVS